MDPWKRLDPGVIGARSAHQSPGVVVSECVAFASCMCSGFFLTLPMRFGATDLPKTWCATTGWRNRRRSCRNGVAGPRQDTRIWPFRPPGVRVSVDARDAHRAREDVHAAPARAGGGGTIDGKKVEVKTVSPEKGNNRVLVKRLGDFEQLLIVRIDENFQFTGKLIDRSRLMGGGGRFLRARTREADGH